MTAVFLSLDLGEGSYSEVERVWYDRCGFMAGRPVSHEAVGSVLMVRDRRKILQRGF